MRAVYGRRMPRRACSGEAALWRRAATVVESARSALSASGRALFAGHARPGEHAAAEPERGAPWRSAPTGLLPGSSSRARARRLGDQRGRAPAARGARARACGGGCGARARVRREDVLVPARRGRLGGGAGGDARARQRHQGRPGCAASRSTCPAARLPGRSRAGRAARAQGHGVHGVRRTRKVAVRFAGRVPM